MNRGVTGLVIERPFHAPMTMNCNDQDRQGVVTLSV